MGNYASKLLFYFNESRKECSEHQTIIQQATMENNSICTPISEKRILSDPRSVSAGIRRTPIEIKCISIGESRKTPNAIPKYLQKNHYFETDMEVVMPPLTIEKHPIPISTDNEQSDSAEVQDLILNVNVARSSKVTTPTDKERFTIFGLDPRSPAVDFDRTPILMPKSLALIKARSQENLSHGGSYETNIYNLKNSCQEIGTLLNVPEIQLSNATLENLKVLNTEEQDGLISTSLYNFDLSISKSEKEDTVIKNLKYTNGEKKSFVSNEQTVAIDNKKGKYETEKQDDYKSIEFNTKIKDNKIKLWYDSLSSEESASGKKDKKELSQEKVSREDIIITFDKYTMIGTSLKPVKTDFRKKRDIKGKKKKNTEIDVKFNEEKVFTPENKQEIENRTPLGNRSNNGQIQKKPHQLLRNKNASIGTQENTPPHKIGNGKIRNGIQWDPNSTVLI